jgi:hypothetical protein
MSVFPFQDCTGFCTTTWGPHTRKYVPRGGFFRALRGAFVRMGGARVCSPITGAIACRGPAAHPIGPCIAVTGKN